ncbi:helix-turn-helix domain-containing protein [Actinocorallia longicatena]
MAADRRIGSPDAKNRTVLLDAVERLMVEEGYAAVSSRRVAERAGLKPQLVHYYFRTMDDLFLAVLRRRAEEGLAAQARILASPQPLRALWEFSVDRRGSALTMEFAALANHRKALRAEIALYSERFRAQQAEAFAAFRERRPELPGELTPVVMSVLVTSLSRVFGLEETIGMSAGHAETLELVERLLTHFEGEALPTFPIGDENGLLRNN